MPYSLLVVIGTIIAAVIGGVVSGAVGALAGAATVGLIGATGYLIQLSVVEADKNRS